MNTNMTLPNQMKSMHLGSSLAGSFVLQHMLSWHACEFHVKENEMPCSVVDNCNNFKPICLFCIQWLSLIEMYVLMGNVGNGKHNIYLIRFYMFAIVNYVIC